MRDHLKSTAQVRESVVLIHVTVGYTADASFISGEPVGQPVLVIFDPSDTGCLY